jgi:hypothetical protein
MGRSFYFSFDNIEFPPKVPNVSTVLETLNSGDLLEIKLDTLFEPSRMARAPSTYGEISTPLMNGVYFIINSNYENLSENNISLRSIFVKPFPNQEELFSDWIITTDGYVREIEAYSIIGKILEVKIHKHDQNDISNDLKKVCIQ